MVASSGHEIYSTFQHDMNAEEGARSSGESSGLQSPMLLKPSFSPTHSFRCRDQLEAQGAAAIIAPHYEYESLTAQQPPLVEISLHMSRANAHPTAYPEYYSVSPPPRSQISHGYVVQQVVHPHFPAGSNGRPVESRYTGTSERRLPGGPSHGGSSLEPGGQARTSAYGGDQKPPMSFTSEHQEPPATSTAPAANDPRTSQKQTSTAVIACRQWWVSRSSMSYFIKSLIKPKTTN
ncbi:hypothetical protein C0992_010936 [Termitomyces sp. T32_za158]|nr:hypothetical protein C0992_010936 [Termitomyces sp. T32_za158]